MSATGTPRLRGRSWLCLCVLVGVVALSATATASAAPGHRLSRSFGSDALGQLTSVGGVAVRAATSDVFVADPAANSVKLFSTAGDFLLAIDSTTTVLSPTFVARDSASGDVYVGGTNPLTGSGGAVARYSSRGDFKYSVDVDAVPGGLAGGIGGLALDSRNGRLYVSDLAGFVDVFSNSTSSATYLRQFGGFGGDPGMFQGQPGAVAVDGVGDIYITEPSSRTQKFEGTDVNAGSNPYLNTVGSGAPQASATDDANSDVYVVEAPDFVTNQIDQFDSSGAPISPFGAGDFGGVSGIGVDSATKNVFVGDPTTNTVKVFVPFIAPLAVTGGSAAVSATSATVLGTVDPDGVETRYYFEYGKDTSYGSPTATTPVGAGSDPVDVSADLDALQPNTTYHYRLVATNAQGRVTGTDETFTTPAGAPTVSNESATSVTSDGATLNAQVNPNGFQATSYFEYGTTPAYGSSTPEVDSGSGTDNVPLTARIMKLEPNTTYHFRAVSSNGVGVPARGEDQTFTTPLASPIATVGSVTAIARGSATLNGSIDTQGLSGSYSFTVSATNSPFSVTTSPVDVDGSPGSQNVSVPISGLPDAGALTVRLRITTSTATTISDPTAFSTPAGPPPIVPSLPESAANPYDCVSPKINTPRGSLRAGRQVVLTGRDLGFSGVVTFGSRRAVVTEYSPQRVAVVVPSQVRGSVTARIQCARASNDIAVRVLAPSNAFSAKLVSRGSTGRLTLKIPGPGHVVVRGKYFSTLDLKPRRAGVVAATLRLNSLGRKRLAAASSKRFTAAAEIRYRPTGGSTRSTERRLTLRR